MSLTVGVTPWGRFREELQELAEKHCMVVDLAPSTDGRPLFFVEPKPRKPTLNLQPEQPTPMEWPELKRRMRVSLLSIIESTNEPAEQRIAACAELRAVVQLR